MSFPPQAFIIGAQKSATTSLADLLGQHPALELSNPKEPDFLTVKWHEGIDWYRACFKRHDKILVDASVNYTMATITNDGVAQTAAPARLKSLSPNARFIYIVRDPAHRCYSAYWHDVRAGREKRPLREAVGAGAYYVAASYYAKQLRAFLEHFPRDRFLVLNFSDFAQDPHRVANRCLEFFAAKPHPFEFALTDPKNGAFDYNLVGRSFRSFIGNEGIKQASAIASKSMPKSVISVLKRSLTSQIPHISQEDYAWLSARFEKDAADFAHMTGVVPR